MFGNQVDDQFANSVSSASAAARGNSYWGVLLLLVFGVFALLVWANHFEIEEVTTGSGKVIPSKQLQVVQSLEGGIVNSISVKEGDVVEVGQVLMQIDDTNFSSRLGELTRQETSLLAERVRLLAEASQSQVLTIPADLQRLTPIAVAAERHVFTSRRIQLLGELDVLNSRLRQRKAELQELAARNDKLTRTMEPLKKEAVLTKRLLDRGIVPEVEYLRLASRLAEIQGDIEVVKASVPRVHAAVKEAEKQIETTRNTYVLSARERLARLEAELAVVQETMTAAADRVSRTLLRSPVHGIVNKINASTVGAVVQSGKELVEIVPLDDGLLIEVAIRPQDVAFIKPGDQSSVKLTAYDYLIYGALQGTVIRIGADTIADPNGDRFFRVIVSTTENHLGADASKLRIIPGMVATVDLQTGKNTVLSYLLKPILRARKEALRER